jgi:hypothetical protein
MAFQVSPGVLVQERDLTRIIPAVSTSVGAFAGQFSKGPLDEIVTVSSEQELVDTFSVNQILITLKIGLALQTFYNTLTL